jgi:hypothetical protein
MKCQEVWAAGAAKKMIGLETPVRAHSLIPHVVSFLENLCAQVAYKIRLSRVN